MWEKFTFPANIKIAIGEIPPSFVAQSVDELLRGSPKLLESPPPADEFQGNLSISGNLGSREIPRTAADKNPFTAQKN
jgi:hypothetical protein